MGKIVVTEFVSLDGVMEDPGGAEGTPHGGWTIPYWNDDIAAFKKDELDAADAMLLGRVTYSGFAAAWPTMTDEAGFADRMNSIPKYVVTSTLDTLTWNNSTRLEGDVATAVRALKDRVEGSILVGGSATLVHELTRHGLVDEYRLVVYPVVLGRGKRVFDDAYAKLQLTYELRTGTGALLLSYGALSES